MSYSTKYTADEIKIVRKIKDCQTMMSHHRKKSLDWDTKRIILIHSLKGKYIPKYNKNKQRKWILLLIM